MVNKTHKNIKKNFIWNVFGSLIFSVTSLLYMIIITRINGIEEAGIFTFAFTTSCLFQVIGNYAGRTFQVTERSDSYISSFDFIFHKFITCIMMLFFVFCFLFFKQYSWNKTILIIFLSLLKLIEAFADSYYAIMQQQDELYKSGISMTIKGIGSIIVFLLVDVFTGNLIFSVVCNIIFSFIIFFIYDKKNVHKYELIKNEIKFKNMIYIFKNGFYVFLITFLTQYVVNAPKYAIDNQLSNSIQTIFGMIVMPATLVILSGQFLVQPLVVSLSNNYQNKNYNGFMKLLLKIIISIFVVGLFIAISGYLIGIPVLELVYGTDLSNQRINLVIILMGATLYAISFLFSTVLIIMRKNQSQAIIFIIVSIFTCFFSSYMVSISNLSGAVIAYFTTMLLLLFLYIIVFGYFMVKFKEK